MSSNTMILIVDDSMTVRMDLMEAFETAGFHPLACATGAEAREALSHGAFDVVVLDVVLPDADGVELLAEIRRSSYGDQTTVLMLSSEVEVKARLRGLHAGADEYIGKPYDAGYVVARTRELLRAREAPHRQVTTVLVIDDSVTFREELRFALEKGGYNVLSAATGEEGLRMAADEQPDAIVVDGVLPGIDGTTVIRRLRMDATSRGVPCVLLTGSEDHDVELEALDAGADTFVRKDEDLEVILARLTAVLRTAARFRPTWQTASLAGPKRILVVDDSMTYLQSIASALRGDGYDVVLAHCGEEALALLAMQPVDCLLLDVVMPGLGGLETCRRIKASTVTRHVPLIMLTSLDGREAMTQGLGAGADDFLTKASEFDVLSARVRAQLRRRQFEDENRSIRDELMRKSLEAAGARAAAAEARAARELVDARAFLVEKLEQKNKELEAFSYSVSHDLRAPLRSIDGFSQALLDDCAGVLDEKSTDHLRRVRAAAQRMGVLIDDLVKLAQVGRGELTRGRTNLSEIASLIVPELRKSDPHRQVEVSIQDGLVVEADFGLMRVVLDNLLGNAWKFTSKVPDAKIEFGRELSDDDTIYYVRDNGAGFEMTYADKLFRPFQRLHAEADFPGTGIGLATIHRIIDRHGGRVWVQSAVGRGTTLYFTVAPPVCPKVAPVPLPAALPA